MVKILTLTDSPRIFLKGGLDSVDLGFDDAGHTLRNEELDKLDTYG